MKTKTVLLMENKPRDEKLTLRPASRVDAAGGDALSIVRLPLHAPACGNGLPWISPSLQFMPATRTILTGRCPVLQRTSL